MDRGSGFQFAGSLLDGAHDTEQIAPVNLLDVFGGVALFEESTGKSGELAVGVQVRRDAAYAVEVGSNTNAVDAADLNGVIDLRDDVGQRCRWTEDKVTAEERIIDLLT